MRRLPSVSLRCSCGVSFWSAGQRSVPSGWKAKSWPEKRPAFQAEPTSGGAYRRQEQCVAVEEEKPEQTRLCGLGKSATGALVRASGSRPIERSVASTPVPMLNDCTTLFEMCDNQHDLPEPERRTGNQLGRYMDLNGRIDDTCHTGLLVGVHAA